MTVGGTQIFVKAVIECNEEDVIIYELSESPEENFRKVNGWDQSVSYQHHA